MSHKDFYVAPRFRIVPKAPSVYLVQRKTGLFWWTEMDYCVFEYPKGFTTKEAARAYIDEELAKSMHTYVHLRQPIEEYPA